MKDRNAWPAPAKLNLFLHVLGRRADGYHLLQTVFQFIDSCDWLRFGVRGDGHIHRLRDVPGVPPELDLAVRAARLLQEETGCTYGADIELEKNLPLGAGLGGGSSDAATTLLVLNKLWGLELPLEQLAALGARLGADIPVFIFGRSAWAEGVGEILTPIILPEPWYVVLIPACHVSTAEIFALPELTRNAPPITISAFRSGEGRNACEPVVCSRYPAVGEALVWLSRFSTARMSGTGAAVFAAFNDEAAARQVADQVPPGMRVIVARGCNRSPLHEKLNSGF